MNDATLGQILLIFSGCFVFYYTFWVIVLPLLPLSSDNILFSIFPDLIYAIVVPVILGTIFLGTLIMFTLYHVYPHLKIKAHVNKYVNIF